MTFTAEERATRERLGIESAGPSSNGQDKPRASLVIRNGADVEAVEIDWLWPGWIPLGYLTLLAGETGAGKGFIEAAITSAITNTNGRFPDGSISARPGRVLVVCNEDAPETMLKPRLLAAGANVSMVEFVEVARIGKRDEPIDIEAHRDLLESALEEYDPRMLVLNPIDDVAMGVNSNASEEVRRAFVPFLRIVHQRFPRLAVLGIKHPNKNRGETNARSRISGSTQWVAMSRALHMILEDPETDGRRYLLPAKTQHGKRPQGLAFEITDSPLWPSTGVAVFEANPVTETADDVLHEIARGKKPEQWERAANWLVDELTAEEGSLAKKEIVARGERAGFKQRLLEKAAEKDDRIEKDHVGSVSWWRVSKPLADTISDEACQQF